MRAIIHIGADKTGTTSVQRSLFNQHQYLARHGVAYPFLEDGTNHNLLAAPFLARPMRIHLQRYKTTPNTIAKANQCWKKLQASLAKGEYDTVVLSAESLFSILNPELFVEKLAEYLPHLREILIFVYLRRPSTHYMSLVQQQLKRSARFSDPKRPQYAAILKRWSNVGRLNLREFDRKCMINGDVVTDFWVNTLPSIQLPESAEVIRSNVSMSAEGLLIFQRFRHAFCAHREGMRTKRSKFLLSSIRLVEQSNELKMQFSKASLKPELRDFLDYATSDNAELEKFFDFKYRFMVDGQSGEPAIVAPISGLRWVDELVEVDPERVDCLLHLLKYDKTLPLIHRLINQAQLRNIMNIGAK